MPAPGGGAPSPAGLFALAGHGARRAQPPGTQCGALLAGAVPDGRGPSHSGPGAQMEGQFAFEKTRGTGLSMLVPHLDRGCLDVDQLAKLRKLRDSPSRGSSWAEPPDRAQAARPLAVAPETCLQCHAAVTQAGSGAPSLKWQAGFLSDCSARFGFPLASTVVWCYQARSAPC